MRIRSSLLAALTLVGFSLTAVATMPTAEDAAQSVNQLGLDLYRQQAKSAPGGVLLSPYSIGTALALTYLGADGSTAQEMQRVLHLPGDSAQTALAFRELGLQLDGAVADSRKEVERLREFGGQSTPLQLDVANRLFAQRGHAFRPSFLRAAEQGYRSTLAELDFRQDPQAARATINAWVAGQTHDRIRDLLPEGAPDRRTRLVLVNALYLKAAWAEAFHPEATQAEPFHFSGRAQAQVPMMHTQRHLGYAKRDGYSVVTLPYLGHDLQLVLVVPDAIDGLPAVEAALGAEDLAGFRRLSRADVILALPRFKLEPATLPLGDALKALGLRTAFDEPRGSADFGRMAPRTPEDYLKIDQVFHKTWLSLDEHGTEAAAATAVMMAVATAIAPREDPPVTVRADRPFLFAIQHVDSGACLFLGRVTDPR